MDRYFFISGDLDDMDSVEKELENAGVTTAQIHVLSKDDDGVARRNLHEVHAFMKTDVVRSGLREPFLVWWRQLQCCFSRTIPRHPKMLVGSPLFSYRLSCWGSAPGRVDSLAFRCRMLSSSNLKRYSLRAGMCFLSMLTSASCRCYRV